MRRATSGRSIQGPVDPGADRSRGRSIHTSVLCDPRSCVSLRLAWPGSARRSGWGRTGTSNVESAFVVVYRKADAPLPRGVTDLLDSPRPGGRVHLGFPARAHVTWSDDAARTFASCWQSEPPGAGTRWHVDAQGRLSVTTGRPRVAGEAYGAESSWTLAAARHVGHRLELDRLDEIRGLFTLGMIDKRGGDSSRTTRSPSRISSCRKQTTWWRSAATPPWLPRCEPVDARRPQRWTRWAWSDSRTPESTVAAEPATRG